MHKRFIGGSSTSSTTLIISGSEIVKQPKNVWGEGAVSKKPLIRLPKHGHHFCNHILTQGHNPQLILHVHSLSEPLKLIFTTLSEIICDLY
ncbi:hypothetical protein VP01_2790g6 [Puccinia sorghi]|uniref:Uncharacterized protein n=1 Tax=Puccinia sorghi TaxID=27349 RepID=A0A0L6V4F1_9BASI|nr:hypothetical protein VP01_2790g6 [Puccinia sorghi]